MPPGFARVDLDPPYDAELAGILSFSSFADAENTLRRLENLRQGYVAAGDKKGVDYCRRIALQGRLRAELIAKSPKVAPQKRQQKMEIATWFRIWLETPEIFGDWLDLRKRSRDFGTLREAESATRNNKKTG